MSAPVFIDTAHAAEMLHISSDAVLDLVNDGKLRPYGGRAPHFFFRTAEVAALVPQFSAQQETEPPKRVKSGSARVQSRLTADARWSDVTEDDIRDWASRADAARLRAARKAVETARQRLDTVLRVLDEKG